MLRRKLRAAIETERCIYEVLLLEIVFCCAEERIGNLLCTAIYLVGRRDGSCCVQRHAAWVCLTGCENAEASALLYAGLLA